MNKALVTKREIILFSVIAILFALFPFLFINTFTNQQDLFSSPLFHVKLVESILFIIFFLLNYFVYTTKFYFKKRYIVYLVLLIVSFIVIHKLPELLIEIERIPRTIKNARLEERRSMRKVLAIIVKFLIFTCATVISLFLRQNKRYQEIKEEKQLSEIAYLRAQINPHFLFNTLNNIYALTLQKSDNASDAVMKLSKMMRFVVSESSKDFVLLTQDLEYIKNYIQLQQLRLVNKSSVEFIVEGNPANLKISPLLLINYIENAFKYGVLDEVENPIKIYITINDKELELYVENKIETEKLFETDKSEVGLYNSKKRLEYLYINKYNLDINEDMGNYYVNLKLMLDD